MVRHLDQHGQLNALIRTNRAVVLALFWAALATCVVGSMVYDIADWISAW